MAFHPLKTFNDTANRYDHVLIEAWKCPPSIQVTQLLNCALSKVKLEYASVSALLATSDLKEHRQMVLECQVRLADMINKRNTWKKQAQPIDAQAEAKEAARQAEMKEKARQAEAKEAARQQAERRQTEERERLRKLYILECERKQKLREEHTAWQIREELSLAAERRSPPLPDHEQQEMDAIMASIREILSS